MSIRNLAPTQDSALYGPTIDRPANVHPNQYLQSLPYQDLRQILQGENAISSHYTGPTNFQLWEPLAPGLHPFSERNAGNWDFTGKSLNGAPVEVAVRYHEPMSPVESQITSFVNAHPYPHDIQPGENPNDYYYALNGYQKRVKHEVKYQIDEALDFVGKYRLGDPLFALPFNGARMVGHCLSKMGIPTTNMFTAQVKRIPLENGKIVIAAGGLEVPRDVLLSPNTFIGIDDCLATGATMKFLKKVLLNLGIPINGEFLGGVIGTRIPFQDQLINSKIPFKLSVSQRCLHVAPNGYLMNNPSDGQMAGDMGEILSKPIGNDSPAHLSWGSNTLADSMYKH